MEEIPGSRQFQAWLQLKYSSKAALNSLLRSRLFRSRLLRSRLTFCMIFNLFTYCFSVCINSAKKRAPALLTVALQTVVSLLDF